jgi:hypothetical protein
VPAGTRHTLKLKRSWIDIVCHRNGDPSYEGSVKDPNVNQTVGVVIYRIAYRRVTVKSNPER